MICLFTKKVKVIKKESGYAIYVEVLRLNMWCHWMREKREEVNM